MNKKYVLIKGIGLLVLLISVMLLGYLASSIEPQHQICPNCEEVMPQYYNYCGNCGKMLHE